MCCINTFRLMNGLWGLDNNNRHLEITAQASLSETTSLSPVPPISCESKAGRVSVPILWIATHTSMLATFFFFFNEKSTNGGVTKTEIQAMILLFFS